jgi:hypothetical protein
MEGNDAIFASGNRDRDFFVRCDEFVFGHRAPETAFDAFCQAAVTEQRASVAAVVNSLAPTKGALQHLTTRDDRYYFDEIAVREALFFRHYLFVAPDGDDIWIVVQLFQQVGDFCAMRQPELFCLSLPVQLDRDDDSLYFLTTGLGGSSPL